MAIEIVTDHRCGTCKSSRSVTKQGVRRPGQTPDQQANMYRCHNESPRGTAFIVGRNENGDPQIMEYSFWPLVEGHEGCEQWRPRIALN